MDTTHTTPTTARPARGSTGHPDPFEAAMRRLSEAGLLFEILDDDPDVRAAA